MAQQDDALGAVAQATAADPLAALRLGTGLQAGHLDIVGLLLLSCDTLGDGLEVLTEYAPIIGDNARFETAALPDGVALRYLPDYAACRELRVEAALGCVVNLARWMTNGRFRPRPCCSCMRRGADPPPTKRCSAARCASARPSTASRWTAQRWPAWA